MIKIVFIDIDGTLFDNDNDLVHQSSIDAIVKLKANGIKVCIASGRSKVLGDEVFKRYNLEFDGYVLINGQYVILNDAVIYRNTIDKNFINQYVEECQRKEIAYGFMTESDTFVSSHQQSVVNAFKNFKMKLPKVIEPDDLEKDIYQGILFDLASLPYFSQKFAQYVRFLPWKHDGADIIPINSSKAIGMAKICEKLNIKQEEVVAIGDSHNDIEMIKFAKIGIAMGNAKPALKAVSTFVTDNIDKDGLASALKKLNLI